MRDDVDSSASSMRPLTLSLARSSSSAREAAGAQIGDLGARDLDALRHVLGARADVDADLAGIVVARRVAVDAVGHAALLADLLHEARRGRAAEHVVEQREREAALVVARAARAPRGRRGTARCRAPGTAACRPRASGSERTAARRRAELQALGDERAERVVLDVAGGRDDDVARAVAARVVGRDVGVGERAHGRGAADHRAAELVLAEDAARREVVHEIGRVVLDHRDLLEHDLALRLERLVLEARARGHVAHDVERERQVLVEHAHVHDGRLARRERVQLGAEAIGDARDLDLVVALAALEEQVLDEMRDAGLGGRSSRAPTPTKTPTATERTVVDLLGDDAQAVGERCLLMHGPEPTSAARGSAAGAARGSPPRTGRRPRRRPRRRRGRTACPRAGGARRVRCRGRQRCAVGPVVRHRVERVDDGDDARADAGSPRAAARRDSPCRRAARGRRARSGRSPRASARRRRCARRSRCGARMSSRSADRRARRPCRGSTPGSPPCRRRAARPRVASARPPRARGRMPTAVARRELGDVPEVRRRASRLCSASTCSSASLASLPERAGVERLLA